MNQRQFFILCPIILWACLNAAGHRAAGQTVAKKPLDHSVYDAWQSVAQPLISADGRYAAYTVAPQEGDTTLYIADLRTQASVRIERGCEARMTDDSRYAVFKIKPAQAEKKEARRQKKKAGEQPRDSLGWIELARIRKGRELQSPYIIKVAGVKSFRLPEKASAYVACMAESPKDTAGGGKDEKDDCLILCDLASGCRDTVPHVKEYVVSKNGKYIAYAVKPPEKDSTALPGVHLYNYSPAARVRAALMEGKGEYKLQSFDDDGRQFVFYATTDTTKRDPKVYNLYYTATAEPQARVVADTLSEQTPAGWAVNTAYNAHFSRNGGKLYFGISPIVAPKDTSIDESEQAQLDVWHYKDDYIQPCQLKQLNSERNRSYLCVFDAADLSRFTQLGDTDLENVVLSDRGNGEHALGLTTKGYRIESQWTGRERNDVYILSTVTGKRTAVATGLDATPALSPAGGYLAWFDRETAQWQLYSVSNQTTRCVTAGLGVAFADSSRQTPEKPAAFGAAGWSRGDRRFYVYDKYDLWQIDPEGQAPPQRITSGAGRRDGIVFRYVHFDKEVDYIDTSRPLLLSAFDEKTKQAGYYTLQIADGRPGLLEKRILAPRTFGALTKAKDADVYLYTQSNFNITPDVWTTSDRWKRQTQLSHINPQKDDYLWGTAEMIKWQSADSVPLKGILYKPENFDPAKRYPMIVYFYERHSDELYRHFAPAPSRSTVNITFYCSRGYLVFTPDIHYVDGHPGRSAYNSVVPGVEELCQNDWVDRQRIGIQGQSWGGYQTAYLITQTGLFAAAGAGAPVANMTSAYGGIRWGTGVNRQMQYERQQSRIGQTLWEAPELYIENSPLFFADRVSTPLLIMHNDADGAVPWYQGIEYFTALRRLGKTVYFLQYNGEEHNLTQRRNMRDLTVRLQQFFDHYLQRAPLPRWMERGVPATEKGKEGLGN